MRIPTAAIDIAGGLREDTEDERDGLARSLRAVGLLQPIVVAPDGRVPGRYTCVAGRRRLLAARRLAWDDIECVVHAGDADDLEVIEITENLHRKELAPLERAHHLRRLYEIWERTHPDDVASLWGEHTPRNKRFQGSGTLAAGVATVARQAGLSGRTVRRQLAADRATVAFTPEQRAAIESSGISAPRAAAVAAIEDPTLRGEAVALLGMGMNYAAAMREVLGEAFAGDAEEDAELTDEAFLDDCPIRPRVNRARFDADALLFRRIADARRKFAREIGWGKLRAEVGGHGGVYFARLARLLEAPHPRDWLQCHDCTQGKTQHGDCRKCGRGGGYQIG